MEKLEAIAKAAEEYVQMLNALSGHTSLVETSSTPEFIALLQALYDPPCNHAQWNAVRFYEHNR
jgi:hypothetical protein